MKNLKNYPKHKTVIIDGYTVDLEFGNLEGIQEVFENLVKWHIENDND